ncbi:MAG: type II toxin-antitoxin system RelE/ParE family toxin [Chloroflexi bacterium]|nr:type II toxin-antitoxin system RelE/ParE family toxin [Chloroflexota bacterium]
MTWRVRHTRTFYKELARLPKEVRVRIEQVAFGDEIKVDPFWGGKVQKLSVYREYYQIRYGDHRVGLRLDKERHIIEFRRILHRKELYCKFP